MGGTEYPPAGIASLFEGQVESRPDAVALSWTGGEWSYRELNRQANLLAVQLRAEGVGKDQVVAIHLPRSPQCIAAMLGILKAGAAYLPLDPRSPPQRLRLLCAEASARVVIGPERRQLELPDPGNPSLPVDLDDLAYVMYTSGSTGIPKGVAVPQRGVIRLLFGAHYAHLGPETVCLHHSPGAFDASTLEVWGPLLHGGKCVLAPAGLDLETLAACIEDSNLTMLWLTASLFNVIVETAPRVLARVPHVLTGGEALSTSHVRRAQEAAPETRFTNAYGPTESTTFTCTYAIPRGFVGKRVPIGRPIGHTIVRLLDEELRLVQRGSTGEIYIGGDGLARGYLNRPELTSAAFVPDPFSDSPGRRLYRTGDLARELPDGALDFIGRRDHQVKVRGFRIEPEEVEAVLRSHPMVAGAGVIARGETAAERRLVAVVARSREVSARELREYLSARLPDYMVPAHFEFLPELPLTTSGKLDRRALERIPETEAVNSEDAAPACATEAQLAALVAGLLHLRRVNAADNFFELGGHSLSAMQLLTRVKSAFGVNVGMREFYGEPTVAALARLIRLQQPVPGDGSSLPRRRGGNGPAPLSFPQEGLWTLDRMGSGGPHHLIPWAVELRGELKVRALREALSAIVRRHEALRTVFRQEGAEAVQVVLEPAPVPLQVREALDEQDWRRQAEAFARQRISLANGPMMHGEIYRLSDGRHVLLLVFHHIVFDGWSLGILRRELSEFYNASAAGRAPDLPDLPLQYSDFAAWQRASLCSFQARPELDGAAGLLELPVRRRPARPSYDGRRLPVLLERDDATRLQALANTEGVTLFTVLLAGFVAVLFRYSSQEDLVIGTPWANRMTEETESLIGYFINTLVIRTRLEGNPSFRELLARVKEATLDAISHGDLPFAKLLERVRARRDLAHHPVFQVMFMLQNAPRGELRLTGLDIAELPVENGTSQFDLSLSLEEIGDEIRGYLEYSTDLFDGDFAQGLVRHYGQLLRAAISSPCARIADLPLMTDDECSRARAMGRGDGAPYPETSLAACFERKAIECAGSIALVTSHGNWTYEDLRRQSNALAWRLRELGADQQPVGICMGRSPEMVAGLLGILKAGAAYVPLDPAYPENRLAWMLEDSGAEVVVTDRRHPRAWSNRRVRIVYWEELEQQGANESPPIDADPDRLAYILYTSGSTGSPKGVGGQHRAVMNRLQWMWSQFPFAPGERCCLKTPLSFIDSVWEIFGPLLAGVPAVVVAETVLGDSRLLVDWLARTRVTRIVMVPSLLHAILDSVPDLGRLLPDLRMWTSSGEALTPELAQRFFDSMPGRVLLNLYGSSEVCADVSWHVVKPGAGHSVPIGRPIANTQLAVLDANRQLAPLGVPGELYVGGVPLARGYWRNAALTAERFIDGPMGRLFRTGDRAVCGRNGEFEFLGRVDRQVKIRGQRVEPDESAAVLRQLAGVREAAVVACAGADGQVFLEGFVALDRCDPADLTGALRQRLPEAMIPRSIHPMAKLPLLPNGKVDRQALVAMAAESRLRAPAKRAPADPIERRLASIWEDLIQVHPIDPDTDFFEAGGTSLMAIRLFSRIEREMGHILPVASIFESGTIAKLASLLRHPAERLDSAAVCLRPGDDGTPLFCLHGLGGDVMMYRQLALALGSDSPVYGIRAHGRGGKRPSRLDMNALLDDYLGEIRKVQPAGPYRLCGSSFGGLLAYAMACKLREHNESVSFLGVVDASATDLLRMRSVPAALRWAALRFRPKLWRYCQDVSARRWKRLRRDVKGQLRRLSSAVWRAGVRAKARVGAEVDFSDTKIDRLWRLVLASYKVQPYDGSLALFRATESSWYPAGEPEDLNWSRIVRGPVSVVRVSGDHLTIIQEPHVQELAEAMRAYERSSVETVQA